jgi:hypothetical protein
MTLPLLLSIDNDLMKELLLSKVEFSQSNGYAGAFINMV